MGGVAEDFLDISPHIWNKLKGSWYFHLTLPKYRIHIFFQWYNNSRIWFNILPRAANILSHSSRTKCLIFFRLRTLEWQRARILPGVPTIMCGQFFFRTSSSFLMDIPPKKTAIFTLFMYLLNLSYSLLIWKANSLVCASTNTDTCMKQKLRLLFLFI